METFFTEDKLVAMEEPEEEDEEEVMGDEEDEEEIKENMPGPEDGEESAAQKPTWAPCFYYRAGKEVYNYVGQEIIIQESLDSFAGMIWPAALTLCHYLETHHKELSLVDKAVLEIGAGTGLLSIVATLLGAWVTATDLPNVLSNMRANLCRNTRGHCRHTPQVSALSWGYDLENTYPRSVYRYDYVLAADVVYHHDFLKELLATMKHFCQAGTTLIWANKVRFETDQRFTENFKKTFNTRLLFDDGEMKIFVATCRETSIDTDLTEGTHGEVKEEQREGEGEEEEELMSGERCSEEFVVYGEGEEEECVDMQQQKGMEQTLRTNSKMEECREEHQHQGSDGHDDDHEQAGGEEEEDEDEKGEEDRCSLSPEDVDSEDQADDREADREDSDALCSAEANDEDLTEEEEIRQSSNQQERKPAWVPNIFSRNSKDIYYYAGHEIGIHEYIDSYGAVMWPAALAMCSFLDTNRQRVNLLDKKVLELGSGTGLVAIVASLLGASVTATDLPEILGNLRSNVMRNTKARSRYPPKVEELSWGYDLDRNYPTSLYHYDYVLAADVVYHHDSLDELLVTMKHFCQPGTTLIWANKIRFESDQTFIENFRKTFHATLLDDDGEMKIFMATCK